jgi:hypothetical protein
LRHGRVSSHSELEAETGGDQRRDCSLSDADRQAWHGLAQLVAVHRVAHQACLERLVSLIDQKSFVTGHRRTKSWKKRDLRASSRILSNLLHNRVAMPMKPVSNASNSRLRNRASPSHCVSPKGVRTGNSIHRDNCLVPDGRARTADESSRIWPRRVMA